ncbi:hypothetical protein A2160_01775 [Candidatus Beckwithbacteria bacterium RBG_13_42_9]|uniref:Uncharacterized protein n=1 Tax=Candidatus Beckwithbacteria bacterium RBG_13_42_9 TaxID=1797457 RepID=A0A1F5E863_9BACT|nr:MAG: hypothetical protein A2160_01775 [Candidatus Beckwithbacteria bacterium RBG_13_42_9]
MSEGEMWVVHGSQLGCLVIGRPLGPGEFPQPGDRTVLINREGPEASTWTLYFNPHLPKADVEVMTVPRGTPLGNIVGDFLHPDNQQSIVAVAV